MSYRTHATTAISASTPAISDFTPGVWISSLFSDTLSSLRTPEFPMLSFTPVMSPLLLLLSLSLLLSSLMKISSGAIGGSIGTCIMSSLMSLFYSSIIPIVFLCLQQLVCLSVVPLMLWQCRLRWIRELLQCILHHIRNCWWFHLRVCRGRCGYRRLIRSWRFIWPASQLSLVLGVHWNFV